MDHNFKELTVLRQGESNGDRMVIRIVPHRGPCILPDAATAFMARDHLLSRSDGVGALIARSAHMVEKGGIDRSPRCRKPRFCPAHPRRRAMDRTCATRMSPIEAGQARNVCAQSGAATPSCLERTVAASFLSKPSSKTCGFSSLARRPASANDSAFAAGRRSGLGAGAGR